MVNSRNNEAIISIQRIIIQIMYQIRLNKAPNEAKSDRVVANPGRIIHNKQNYQSNVTVKYFNRNARGNQSPLIKPRITRNDSKLKKSQRRRPLLTLQQQQQPAFQRGYNLHVRTLSTGNDHSHSKINKVSRVISQINMCANHPIKPAEYTLRIQADELYYCCSCAIKLASQGFTVQKIQETTIKKQQAKMSCSPHKLLQPFLDNQPPNQKVMILQTFLSTLYEVEQNHYTRIQQLSKVDEIYQRKISNVFEFYADLISFVQQMCDDHIRELQSEARRNSQIAFIELDYLQNNIEEIKGIWSDVKGNLDDILQRLCIEEFKDSIKFYHNKIHVYEHKIEEMEEFLNNANFEVSNDYYQNRLHTTKQFIMNIWREQNNWNIIKQEEQEKQNFCISKLTCNDSKIQIFKNQSQMMIKPSQLLRNKIITQPSACPPKKQTAFRVLFDSEQQPPIMQR